MSILIALDISSRIAGSYSSLSGLEMETPYELPEGVTCWQPTTGLCAPYPFPSSSILLILLREVVSHGSGLYFPVMSC